MKKFDGDRDAVVERALKAGVMAIVDVGLEYDSNRRSVEISGMYPSVFPTMGFHPHDASKFDAMKLARQIVELGEKAVAFGEIGLDFFKEYSPRATQISAFEELLGIAKRYGKPVVIHCREAQDTLMPMLRAAGLATGGVMHCFPGDVDLMTETLDLGFHIAVGGPATYPNTQRLERVIGAVPRDRLILETDCPYLTPQKFRGQRNEPAYIPLIAERVAQIWKIPTEEVGEITSKNVIELFKLELPKK